VRRRIAIGPGGLAKAVKDAKREAPHPNPKPTSPASVPEPDFPRVINSSGAGWYGHDHEHPGGVQVPLSVGARRYVDADGNAIAEPFSREWDEARLMTARSPGPTKQCADCGGRFVGSGTVCNGCRTDAEFVRRNGRSTQHESSCLKCRNRFVTIREAESICPRCAGVIARIRRPAEDRRILHEWRDVLGPNTPRGAVHVFECVNCLRKSHEVYPDSNMYCPIPTLT
jgi:hypothetical protein